MRTIWKFPLEVTDRQPVAIPSRRQLLDIQMQGDTPCLWALVDPESPRTSITIRMYGTGHAINDGMGPYIGTFQFGSLVFHAFEVTP